MKGVAGGAFSHAGPLSLGQVATKPDRSGKFLPRIAARNTIPTLHVAAILLLSGCASIPNAPKEVRIPVAVPCIAASDLPAKPDFVTDAALSVMTDGDLILSLAADRRQNQGYRAELEAALAGCVK